MKKLLGFASLTLILLLTACTADSLDEIVEAGTPSGQQFGEGSGGVPVTLSIGSVVGSTELTRSPMESVGSNFQTPTGASASDYKYMGVFALAQSNLFAVPLPLGSVATGNIKWDGTVSQTRLLWNHPTMASIANEWNGTSVADYTKLQLMDPTTLETTPTEKPYSYPNNNWYNYYFYTYYPRVADNAIEVSADNVVTANYSLDGSQDIITGYAMPPVAQANNGFCGNYFSDIKRAEGSLPFNKQPQLQLTHHLAQLRFFVCSEADPAGTFQVKGITLLNIPTDWSLVIADKSDIHHTGLLISNSGVSDLVPVRTMMVDVNNNMTSATDAVVYDGTSYTNLTTEPAIAGYAMVPSTTMLIKANNEKNRTFNTTYKVRLVVKSGDVVNTLERDITTPEGGFLSGKVYNVIIRIDQTSIVAEP